MVGKLSERGYFDVYKMALAKMIQREHEMALYGQSPVVQEKTPTGFIMKDRLVRELGKGYRRERPVQNEALKLFGNDFTHLIVDEIYQHPGKVYPKPLAEEIALVCGHKIEPIDFLTQSLRDLRI